MRWTAAGLQEVDIAFDDSPFIKQLSHLESMANETGPYTL